MSKWTPLSAWIAASEVSCIHACRASVPCSVREGSSSSAATACSTVAPGPAIWAATASCSATTRASSSSPHRYVSSRSTVAPRNARDHRAYRSRPAASDSGACGASSSARKVASVAYAARAAVAPCSSSARTREQAADSSSTESTASPVMNEVKKEVSGSACSAAWRAHSSTWRFAATAPVLAARRRDSMYPSIAVGRALSRAAMFDQPSTVPVGMMSKTSRRPCTGEAMLLRSRRNSPAACSSSSRPRRSCMAASVIWSTSSVGATPSRACSVVRASAARASRPAGDRSVISWS